MSLRAAFLMVFVLIVRAMGQESPPTVAQRVDRWMWYSKEMDERSMTPSDKGDVTRELRRRLPSLDAIDHQVAQRLLIRLGDPQTIAEVIQILKQSDERSPAFRETLPLLASVLTPSLVPSIAEVLNVQEEARLVEGGELPIRARSVEAAGLIERLVLRSPEFPPEVRQWGEALQWKTYEEYRATFRQWWEQNQQAFARQDYGAVKPLRPVGAPAAAVPPRPSPPAPTKAPVAPAPAARGTPSALPLSAPAADRSAARGATAAPRAPAADATPPSQSPPISRFPWPMVAGGVLLLGLAALGVFALRRNHRG